MKIIDVAKLNDPDVTDGYSLIKALSNRSFPESDLDKILKEVDIDYHDIMDPFKRKDKDIYKPKAAAKKSAAGIANSPMANPSKLPNSNEQEMEYVRTELANRIPLSFQQLICDKRVSFCLANPVVRTYSGIDKSANGEPDEDAAMFEYALERILRDNKIVSHDREVARNIFTYTEVAEYWYTSDLPDEKRSKRYGFDSNKRVKVALYKRTDGYKFFPIKNAEGDLICFSMQYKVKEGGKAVTYFRVFTDEEIATYKRTGAWDWEQVGESIVNTIRKIPFVFGWQRHPEYRNVSRLISRLEKLLSNHGEVNDYHSAPKLLLTDAENISGVGEKGESGIVLQAKGKADAKYITWDNATESVKLEIENLLTMIYTLTQTPNINFDNIKGLGAVSGVSIKLLFTDTHLAVKDKEGLLNDFYQRRHSIIGAYIAVLEPDLEDTADQIEVNTELVPFMVTDDRERADIAQIENGGLPVKSQYKTIIEAGGDQEEVDRIKQETKERDLVNFSEPTNV